MSTDRTDQSKFLLTRTIAVASDRIERVVTGIDHTIPIPSEAEHGWQAPQEDFPGVEYITLQPGEEHLYVQTRSFALPGDYFAEPVLLDSKGRWGGILPYVRVWFTVTSKISASTDR